MLYYKEKNGGIKMAYQIYCGKGFDTQKAERFFLIICAYKESNRKSLIPAVLLIADGMSGILKSGDMIKTQDA